MIGKALRSTQWLALSAMVFFSGNTQVYAVNLGVSQTPLFLGSSVQPNVFIVSDDSGSMDWETMMPTYWRYDAYHPDRFNRNDFDDYSAAQMTDGTWRAAVFHDSYTEDVDGAYGYLYGRTTDLGGGTAEDNVYSLDCDGSYYRGAAEDCNDATDSPFDVDWRVRSADLNTIFFNPNITYEPWAGPCGYGDCTDSDFNAARSNPHEDQDGYDYVRDMATDGDAQGGPFAYEVWIDDSGYDNPALLPSQVDGHPDSGPNFDGRGAVNNEPDFANGEVDLWDSHVRIRVRDTDAIIEVINYGPQTVGTGLNETVAVAATLSGTACYDVLGPKALVVNAYNTSTWATTGAEGCRTIAEAQQDIANWFTYYRRRAFPVKNAVAAIINAQPNFRYGMTLINRDGETGNNIFTQIPDVSVTNLNPHNTTIKEEYFQYVQESNGTPLRRALDKAGLYYSDDLTGKDNPIAYSCQKNFVILFTDGYYNSTAPSMSPSDQDGDGDSYTLADVAYKYYINDINTTMENNVEKDTAEYDLPTYDDDNERTHQHMVTFTVAFGVSGQLTDADDDGKPDTDYAGNNWTGNAWLGDGEPNKGGNWGPSSTGPDKIDDMWHAAYNTSGTFASASTPDEITEKLINAISNIANRQAAASAVALNSGTLNANSRVYQAKFDSNDWSGSIKSVPIQDGPVDELPLGNPDGIDDSPAECAGHPGVGELCDEEWDAADLLVLRGWNTRDAFTFSSDTNDGVDFRVLANLGAAQQTAMKTNPDTLAVETDAIGQQRIDYILGDSTHELDESGDQIFRSRRSTPNGKNKMGDIIHSAPTFVGAPDFFYPDSIESDSYNAYKVAQRSRKGVVYVGANDGMLHAFDASNDASKGQEMFAYIPGRLIDKLPLLTSETYNTSHTYFVDGSPVSFDAYNGGWKTLLVSSVGAGGQVVFGLDVTDPENFSEDDVLWEFTDNPRTSGGDTFGDIDLGYTIGEVSYGRMNDGTWVAIFGNGFNNTIADGNASTTGNAAIYVVNAFTGALLKKFDTGAGMAEDPTGQNRPNGISRVTPVDVNGDFKVDYLYAADLFGNVWKMNTRSSSTSSWESAYFTGADPKPFYQAVDENGDAQSVTTGVAVKRHPEKADQTLVLFGTGSYFQIDDATTTQTQTFYSIWDDNTGIQYDRADLLEQEILDVQTVGADDRQFRVTSSADVDPANYKIDWLTHKGWYMDLGFVHPEANDEGERVNVDPILRGNRIIFVTLTPDPDPCADGGTSWIMELNANDGSRLNQSPFDVNGDGLIDDLDVVSFGGDDETVTSGVRSKEGIVAKPGILNTQGNKELKFFSGTSGNIETVDESVNVNTKDRQSWRQLR